MNFRFQQSTGELTDFSQIRRTRRNIARILTILSERDRTADLGGEE
jgi:ribosomal protein L29